MKSCWAINNDSTCSKMAHFELKYRRRLVGIFLFSFRTAGKSFLAESGNTKNFCFIKFPFFFFLFLLLLLKKKPQESWEVMVTCTCAPVVVLYNQFVVVYNQQKAYDFLRNNRAQVPLLINIIVSDFTGTCNAMPNLLFQRCYFISINPKQRSILTSINSVNKQQD